MMQEHIPCDCDACERTKVNETDVTVLKLMADGHTIDEIAQKIGYSVASIKRKRMVAYAKLGVANGTEAVAKAIKQGLI